MSIEEAKPKDNPATATSPKLFISYSWSSPQHEQWVLQLGTELRESSVDVILDKWDLKEGNDAIAFMEKMVADPQIKKVVLVCDKRYAEKADRRSGGVGTEAQIISPEVYSKQDQSKFVAVIAEKDENGKPYMPIYYKSRIYIDLSDNEQYAKNFEQLLRWVFDKPMYVKPELGSKPAFLEEADAVSLGTGSRLVRVIDAIRNNRPYTKGALQDYFETFASNLEKFRIARSDGEFDDLVVESIGKFVPFRNEAAEIFLSIAQYYNTKDAHAQLHRFFERLVPYLDRPEGVQHWQSSDFDNFKFIIHELFLYCIAALLKHEAFDAAGYLVRNRYYVGTNADYGRNTMQSFDVFRQYPESLEYRNTRLGLRRHSVHADLLKQRATGSGVSFEQIMQADFVLYLRNCLDALKGNSSQDWWPVSLLYRTFHNERPFEIFARAESTQYFESLLTMFDIKKKDELAALQIAFDEQKLQVPGWGYERIHPRQLMGFDGLATRP
jgi:hypothetical protein